MKVPSRYGQKNDVEDFAETFALYVRALNTPQHATLREKFPNRFKVVDEIHNALVKGELQPR